MTKGKSIIPTEDKHKKLMNRGEMPLNRAVTEAFVMSFISRPITRRADDGLPTILYPCQRPWTYCPWQRFLHFQMDELLALIIIQITCICTRLLKYSPLQKNVNLYAVIFPSASPVWPRSGLTTSILHVNSSYTRALARPRYNLNFHRDAARTATSRHGSLKGR